MKLKDAVAIECAIFEQLSPYCERYQVAGSVRRNKPEVNDLEIVVVPKEQAGGTDLFGDTIWVRDREFINVIRKMKAIKGEPTGRYTRRIYGDPPRIEIDFFICQRDNFGLMYAIRTGPVEFSHYLTKRAHYKGLKIQGGMLTEGGRTIPIRDEDELFLKLGMPFVFPEARMQYVETVAPDIVAMHKKGVVDGNPEVSDER